MALDAAYREDRQRLWISLVETGATLAEVGEAYGVTRERVRQVVGGGRSPGLGKDPIAALRLIRSNPTMRGFKSFRGVEPRTLRTMLHALGLLPAVERLFRMRMRRYYESQKPKGKSRTERPYESIARTIAKGSFTHGVSGWGNYKCRCAVCANGWKAYLRSPSYKAIHKRNVTKARRQGCPPDRHGTYYGYSHFACRCQACRAAGAEHRKRQNLRRRVDTPRAGSED